MAALVAMLAAGPVLAAGPAAPAAAPAPRTILRPMSFQELPGWAKERHDEALAVFIASCRRSGAASQPRHQLSAPCAAALALPSKPGQEAAKRFFEAQFTPVKVQPAAGRGFTTGYYEPEFEGRLTRNGPFTAPLYARPPDLVEITPASRPAGFPVSINGARRTASGALEPYPDRSAILDGALRDKGLEIAWLKDPFEVFLLQIQGSGRIRLPDGKVLRVGFAARNGHPYTAAGRVLIERGLMSREQVTMPAIKALFASDPALANDVMRQNRSYVFFRAMQGTEGLAGPLGAQGISLTPLRSIAVDPAFHPYGNAFYISGDIPDAKGGLRPLQQLMIAQDTGAAIKGPARLDIYLGSGEAAAAIAGVLKHPVDVVWLRPRGR